MKIKSFISAVLTLLYVAIFMAYYLMMHFHKDWMYANDDITSLIIFGATFLVNGSIGFLSADNHSFPPQIAVLKYHSVFVMLLGTIYALHYSGIMVTSSMEKLIMICAGVLVIFIIIIISAWRHGFFKKETYD